MFFSLCVGNSKEMIRGHGLFMENPKPIIGCYGLYGFRRNTPWLRQKPSVFIGKGLCFFIKLINCCD